MTPSLEEAYKRLEAWCRERNYAGYDPFDGLNSRLFQLTPLNHSRIARLAWLQALKRSPISPRRLVSVPEGQNPKGIALFALAYLSRFRAEQRQEDREEAQRLLAQLLSLRTANAKGPAWGYNFDWQNRAFLAPRGTPTIVPTAFAARAFLEAASTFDQQEYLSIAREACDFILNDLNIAQETADEICWSYSPLDRTRVLNASLLAAETLAGVGAATGNNEYKQLAVRGARYVARRQRPDGSWAYGADDFQSWADNFHTAFILTSFSRITESCAGEARAEFESQMRRGYKFWTSSFFTEDGWPKYYSDRLYPADSHSVGAALVALSELGWLDAASANISRRVSAWAINNLRDASGFFYYQRRRLYTVRTPYMRWSQAWMLYGLARALESINEEEKDEGRRR